MADITHLKRIDTGPVPEVVRMAERVLAGAQSGDIRAIAFAALSQDGGYSTGWATAPGRDHALLGFAACRLSARMTSDPQE